MKLRILKAKIPLCSYINVIFNTKVFFHKDLMYAIFNLCFLFQFFLPHMKKKTDGTSETGETLKKYWKVDDMFEFENLGFTNTVETIKYLICADCEIGPIGWHDINDKKAFYIALDRVKHAD